MVVGGGEKRSKTRSRFTDHENRAGSSYENQGSWLRSECDNLRRVRTTGEDWGVAKRANGKRFGVGGKATETGN